LFFVHVYIHVQICVENFQQREVLINSFVKQWLCDRQLHVTNKLQRTMTSLLLTLISQHNDRLKYEPHLTTPLDHCSFSNHVPKIFKFCLY
jgi:hypothetical protein